MQTQNGLLKLILDTKALSIWNRKTGPVFWYAANVPGPFYVNTELVIGPALADRLLKQITSIVAGTEDLATRAKNLNQAILKAYDSDTQYREVIAALVAKAKQEFPHDGYSAVSGGERRDWLFSIPFAREVGIKHVFLFKNEKFYCEQAMQAGEKTLHISDLINNAASYFDRWFPILEKAKLDYIGTICINSRGSNGLERLKAHGKKTVVLNGIDLGFFDACLKDGLIDKDTRDEIAIYFSSQKDWASKYLMRDTALFDVRNIDPKSFERLQVFFGKDLWDLRSAHQDFFVKMQSDIVARLKKIA